MPITIAAASYAQATSANTHGDTILGGGSAITTWSAVCAFYPTSAFTGVSAYPVSESGGSGHDDTYCGVRLRDNKAGLGAREPGANTTLLMSTANFNVNAWNVIFTERQGTTVRIQLNGGDIEEGTYLTGTTPNLTAPIILVGALLDGTTLTANYAGMVAYYAAWRNYIPTAAHRAYIYRDGMLQDEKMFDGTYPAPSVYLRLNDNTPTIGGPWTLADTGTISYAKNSATISGATDPRHMDYGIITDIPGCIEFWDMAEAAGNSRIGEINSYALQEYGGSVVRVGDGRFSDYAAYLAADGKYLYCTESALDINGTNAQVTYLAWVRRFTKTGAECICGSWDENAADPDGKRQSALFGQLGASIGLNPARAVVGHVSHDGQTTPGQTWNEEYAAGATAMTMNTAWQFMAVTFYNRTIRSYLNGALDAGSRNPYRPANPGIFNATPTNGFKVGCTYYNGEITNKAWTCIAGLAAYNRALRKSEIAAIQAETIAADVISSPFRPRTFKP